MRLELSEAADALGMSERVLLATLCIPAVPTDTKQSHVDNFRSANVCSPEAEAALRQLLAHFIRP